MDSLTFTIRPLLRLLSRRSCASMAHRSSLMACGIFSLRRLEEFSSPLESQTKSTAFSASSLRTNLKRTDIGERTHPCLPLTRSCPGKDVRSPFSEHRSSHALRIRSDGITSWHARIRVCGAGLCHVDIYCENSAASRGRSQESSRRSSTEPEHAGRFSG